MPEREPVYRMPDLLNLMVDTESSDLHVRVGIPPAYRDSGTLKRVEGPDCEPEDVEYLVKAIANDDQIQTLRTQGGCDFGFAFGTKARFRVSAFKERGNMALVLRQIPNDLLTIEQIGLDQGLVDKLLATPRGMILVTGPTGSGKSTTLASMLNIINETDDECHMITIEDPIEFYHPHKKAVTTQREVHVDVPSFAEALRRALRQDPEVILVGELRDLETIEMAVSAAETGHLVFGTLHTTGAAKTVNRSSVTQHPTSATRPKSYIARNFRSSSDRCNVFGATIRPDESGVGVRAGRSTASCEADNRSIMPKYGHENHNIRPIFILNERLGAE